MFTIFLFEQFEVLELKLVLEDIAACWDGVVTGCVDSMHYF